MGKLSKEALIVALGMVLAGACISYGIVSAFSAKRVVSVKGLAEREVAANKVIWPLAYNELGDDLGVLYQACNDKNAKIVDFLRKNGIGESDITVQAPNVTDNQANVYSSNPYGHRYNVRSCITVASTNVPLVRKLILRQSELLSQGIAIKGNDYENPLVFEFTGLNEVKPEMIEEATKNARAAADKFAQDSDSKLGKIKQAYQGQFSIEDRDANTPHIKKIRVVSSVDYFLE